MPRNGQRQQETSIPGTILRSEKHAQHLWKKTHDNAVKTYGESGRAYRVAYAALKHLYEKKGDRWVKKGWKGPSDAQAARSTTTTPRSTDEPKAPTMHGEVAKASKKSALKSKRRQKQTVRG